MGSALRIADDLRQARDDLEQHDRNVALRRIEVDPAWRAEQAQLVADLEDLLDRAVRFTRREATT
jgi:hypothetical protein